MTNGIQAQLETASVETRSELSEISRNIVNLTRNATHLLGKNYDQDIILKIIYIAHARINLSM